MGFLDLIPLDTFLENLEITTFIFNRNGVTLSEIQKNFQTERLRLKNKVREMIKLKIITIKKIASENDIIITATEKIGHFLESMRFLVRSIDEELKKLESESGAN